jgi:uncharacterized delta-60 repeat protein
MTHTTASRSVLRSAKTRASHTGRSAIAPALLVAGAIVLGPVQLLAAAPGDLDATFGAGGKVLTDFQAQSTDDGTAVAIQPDGKIVVVGVSDANGPFEFALARYAPDGNLDPSFGSGGKVTTSFAGDPDESDQVFAVAIQSDGAIVVGGTADGASFALVRYTAQGALDPSFGAGGKVTTAFGGDFEQVSALAIQPDGKIVAAGVSDANGSPDFALARYNANGSLDQSFGSGGRVLTDFSQQSDDEAFAIAIQPDGKILAAGRSDATGNNLNFAVVRYMPNGQLDPSFGTGGMVVTSFADSDAEGRAIAVQPDGKIVVAGLSAAAFALARYTAGGALDTTFGTGGAVTTTFANAGSAQAVGVAVQSDGKIVAGGAVDAAFAATRYNADGSPDVTFGTGGTAMTSFGGTFDTAEAMALQSDGKIVLAGFSDVNGSDDFALVRFAGGTSTSTPLVSAVLPASRSVQVGTPATAFATIINPSGSTAAAVSIALNSPIAATFSFQTTDPATNQPTGSPNTAVDIAPGGTQSFVITVTPIAPLDPTDVAFTFAGSNAGPAPTVIGLNTLLLSGSTSPVPDIVALAATAGGNGILAIPGPADSAAFAVATVNVGATSAITASADTGAASLPLTLALCQTDPASGQCTSAIGPTVNTSIGSTETPTFAIFATSSGAIPFAPGENRVFVRFKDAGGTTRGSTSVAVRTP